MRLIAVTLLALAAGAFAACPNSCSGHGTCADHDKCTCYARKDGNMDAEGNTVAAWTGPDCSERTCPYGPAWIDDPYAINSAHRNAECSNAGVCDRSTGACKCFDGYEGRACTRTSCPNDCSGHGTCQSAKQFAVDHDEAATTIHGSSVTVTYANAWDSTKWYGCKCETGFRGPDCSHIECPSTADPQGGPDGDGYTDTSTNKVEYRDCSGRGLCDYTTGLCSCFAGAYGEACNLQSALI